MDWFSHGMEVKGQGMVFLSMALWRADFEIADVQSSPAIREDTA